MSVIFSRQCEYALQAVLYIAEKGTNGYTDIKEISNKLEIPHHFLAKILQNLSREGLLRSQKGPSGGFSLNRELDDITLYHIVEAIDGKAFVTDCVLGMPACNSEDPCPVHHQWAKMRESIHAMLSGKTIGEMVRDIKAKRIERDNESIVS
jgi:Rrf2 family transcriptional regulator, iron-sulfur cluster assembly transcription factor